MSLVDTLLSMDDSENVDEHKTIIKAPFGWLGGKAFMCDQINEIMPLRKIYVEPFGGSGITLLKRRQSDIEVFNDRNSGITDFYLTIQDDPQYIIDGINDMIYSKELFYYYKNNWQTITDRKQRALIWYYVIRTSWGGKGLYFGLEKTKNVTNRLYTNLKYFAEINKRLRNVIIENHDYKSLLKYYDSPDTVFYLDPPYTGCDNHYEYQINHTEFLELVFSLSGYVLVSNFESTEYLACDWNETIMVKQRYSMHKEGKNNNDRVEMLYIKESNS